MSNRHRSLAALLLVLAASCATDKITQPVTPFGTFRLTTVNDNLPPLGFSSSITVNGAGHFDYVEKQGSTTTFVSSGQVSLVAQTSNLYFFDATQQVGNANGPCALNCQGYYDGRTLLMNPSPLPPGTGVGDGWRFTSQ